MKVKFFGIQDGKRTLKATISIEKGRIKSDPPEYLQKLLLKGEYIIGKGGKKISISEPEAFLKNLKYAFHGSYTWAEDA